MSSTGQLHLMEKNKFLLFLNDLFNVLAKFLHSSNPGKNLFFKPHKLEIFSINSSGISIDSNVRWFSWCVEQLVIGPI